MSIYSALRFLLSAIILFVFFPLFGQVDTEGKLSQELAMELKEGPEGKKYKIIVVFKDQVDVNKLQEQVLRTLPTRDLQVKTLLDALQLKADRTQEKLISDIEQSSFYSPNSIKRFWIANIIALEVTAPLIDFLLKNPEIAGIEKDAELVSHHKGSIKKTSFIPNGPEIG